MKHLRRSLTYPIAATLVLVTVVPVALAGWLFASYNREHLTTVEKLYLNRQAVNLANELDHFVTNRSSILDSTARALSVSAMTDVSFLDSFLQDMAAEVGSSFAFLQILNKNGEGTYVYDPGLTPDQLEEVSEAVRAAHERVLNGDSAPISQLKQAADRSPWSVMVFPLVTVDGETWGTLSGVIDFSGFERIFASNTFNGLFVHVIDSTGTVVLSSNARLRGRSMAESPLVNDFLVRPLALTSTYTNPLLPDNGEVLGSAAPAASLNWGVVIERPTSIAFAPIRVMQKRTLAVSAIAGLVALGLGFVLSRRLIRPLQALARTSSEISEGKLSVRADVVGSDEIAQLGSNFNHMAENIESLVRKLRHALRQNQELFLETIQTLAAAIDAKDAYTKGHSERVSAYSMAIARHLGLDFEEVFHIRIAAILHDVGKLGIQDSILNKPGGLNDQEYEIMRRHPAIGAQIMSPIRKLRSIIPGIRNHHETWDGNGYPDKLKGEAIPLVARIVGVADTFDAMTTNRPYQKAMTLEYVTAKMKAMAGTRFDPAVIDAFIAAVASGDISPPDATYGGPDHAATMEVS